MRFPTLTAALTVTVATSLLAPVSAGAATAAVGAKCTKAGATSGALVCTRKAGRLVWARAPKSKAPAPAAAAPAGIDGTYRVVAPSQAGYRVKEVLNGQSTEGVGRTKSVTGTLTIAGTKVTAAEITVDLTTLTSDQSRRDRQVQGRILDTAQFPTAKVRLEAPIDLGKVPADKEQVSSPAKVALTVKSTTKLVDITLTARRNGANVEVQGAIPVVFADYGIEDPSFGPFVTTEDNGLIEFLLVFAR